jgi:hypothetical protein
MRENCDRVVLRDSGSQGGLNDAAGWKKIRHSSLIPSSSSAPSLRLERSEKMNQNAEKQSISVISSERSKPVVWALDSWPGWPSG